MLVVGVCTKNCETTVNRVLKTVDRGLEEFFPGEDKLIVVSDGFSKDHTLEIAGNTPTKNRKSVVTQEGGPGKGNGVKTILKIAYREGARALTLVDGDLLSLEPVWIHNLFCPVLRGKDLVVPLYVRHPFDGVITNQVAYPLTTVLHGKEVRQPIGGEFSLSSRFIKKVLAHPLFPEKFGVDVFITTCGIAEGFKVVESVLGRKEHTSTRRYENPRDLLIPMFYQVVGTMFELFLYYREETRRVSKIEKVERLGKTRVGRVGEVKVDVDRLLEFFWEDWEKLYYHSPQAGFLSPIKKEIEDSLEKTEFSFPVGTWAKCVFLGLKNYEKAKKQTLDVLRVFWQARYISLVLETKDLSPEEVEKEIQSQINIFWRYRSVFL